MNVLNVDALERILTCKAASAVHPATKIWITSVARNHILSRLGPEDILENYTIYDPARLMPLMPQPGQLPKWAGEALKRGQILHWFNRHQHARRQVFKLLNMAVAWLDSMPADDTRLRRVDRISFETATKAAALWFKDICENIWLYIKDTCPVVLERENGYRWVQLTTKLHFEREGALMRHCVGNGSYYQVHARKEGSYYSLRDKDNVPRVTVETRGSNLVQCKAQRNSRPAPEHQPHIRAFLAAKRLTIQGDSQNIDAR